LRGQSQGKVIIKEMNMTFNNLLLEVKGKEIIMESIEKKEGKYFAYKKNGKPIGDKNGYNDVRQAVRAFYNSVLSTFQHMQIDKQDKMIDAYLKNKRIQGRNI
jgi:hypothetical protein